MNSQQVKSTMSRLNMSLPMAKALCLGELTGTGRFLPKTTNAATRAALVDRGLLKVTRVDQTITSTRPRAGQENYTNRINYTAVYELTSKGHELYTATAKLRA